MTAATPKDRELLPHQTQGTEIGMFLAITRTKETTTEVGISASLVSAHGPHHQWCARALLSPISMDRVIAPSTPRKQALAPNQAVHRQDTASEEASNQLAMDHGNKVHSRFASSFFQATGIPPWTCAGTSADVPFSSARVAHSHDHMRRSFRVLHLSVMLDHGRCPAHLPSRSLLRVGHLPMHSTMYSSIFSFTLGSHALQCNSHPVNLRVKWRGARGPSSTSSSISQRRRTSSRRCRAALRART